MTTTQTPPNTHRELPWRETLRLAFGLWRARALGGGGRSSRQPQQQQQMMVPAAAGGGEAAAAAAMALGARRMVGACVEMVRFLVWCGLVLLFLIIHQLARPLIPPPFPPKK